MNPLVLFLATLALALATALLLVRAYLWIAEWWGRREARIWRHDHTRREYESWRDGVS